MKIAINAQRWDSPIEVMDVKELRLVQRGNGFIVVYVYGNDKPSLAVEPTYNGGGERIFVFGNHEEVEV